MPTENQSLDTYNKLTNLINSSRFYESFLLLKNGMKLYPSLREHYLKLIELERNYRYMLDYLAEGNPDSSQEEMIEQLRDVLLFANDVLLRERKLVDSPDIYSSTKRLLNVRSTDFKSLMNNWKDAYTEDNKDSVYDKPKISANQMDSIDELFNYVWTYSGNDKVYLNELSGILDDSETPDNLKAIIVSGIVLACLEYFNPKYFQLLLHLYETTDSKVIKARVIAGIILISLLYPNRVKGNLNIRSHILLLSGDEKFREWVNSTLLNIIKTYDTKRVDDKMRNEVLPNLMKMGPELMDKMRNMSGDSEDFLSMENPQWEEMMENSGMADKIQEINDMQMEGADVMFTTFSQLKNFPFFTQISNWFLPFSTGNYILEGFESGDDEYLERISEVMCDSDLHSFLLSLKSIPKDKRDNTLKVMNRQIKEFKDAMVNNIEEENEDQKLAKKIKHTLQDLYRFYKYYRKRNDLKDPFEFPFTNKNISPIISLLGISKENLRIISEFYFKNKYYEEAAGLMELLDKEEPGDYKFWEKIGFSYDKIQRYGEALKWYKKAELINPNGWLNKKLALTLKNSGRFVEALEYFEKALESEPENYHLLMSIGQCFLENHQPAEALSYFYHAQYLKPEKKAPLRAIAWAELLSGNLDKAEAQYQKILDDENRDKTDILNAAHAALANGNFRKSVKLYREFVEKSDNKDITKLVLAFREDAQTLKLLNIKTSDLRLIVDKIRYDIFD